MSEKPAGTPTGSVIIKDLKLTPMFEVGATPILLIEGRGVFVPGVVIPHAWWDRPRLIDRLEVDRPVADAAGVATVAFRGRCDYKDALEEVVRACNDGERELLAREVVPAVLVGMGTAPWNTPDPVPPLEPAGPIGTAVTPEEYHRRSKAETIHDLIRLGVGQAPGVDRDQVLLEAARAGMLRPDQLAGLRESLEPPPPRTRPARRRIVDV